MKKIQIYMKIILTVSACIIYNRFSVFILIF